MSGRGLPPSKGIKQATAKDFSGGWNTTDSPLNISSKFAANLRNLYPDSNGRLRLRFGTTLVIAQDDNIDIVAMEYFNGRIIVVSGDGRITATQANGSWVVIWNATFAAALPGAPAAWGPSNFASFTQFAGSLIICNGVDKPVICSASFSITYLADLGTGSNGNVPRARYCITHADYVILASASSDRTTIHISAKGTSGTYTGDPDPNDAVDFDIATYISTGSPEITGLASFRDKLIVTTDETILAFVLGEYSSADTPVHVPRVDDTIENYGAVSHNTIVPLGDDVLFLDIAGVASIKRALITGTLSPVRESVLVAKEVQNSLAKFTRAQLSDEIFAVHDRIASQLLFFSPKSSTVTTSTDNDVFVFCYDPAQKFRAFTYFDNMPYRAGCRTAEGRVYFGAGNSIYYYHNLYDEAYGDTIELNPALWDDLTTWTDGTGWYPNGTEPRIPTPFNMLTPWTDFRDPLNAKYSKYMRTLIEGTASFTINMFCDRQTAVPDATMEMISTDTPADPLSVVRPSDTEQLYAWPTKFNRMRIQVTGSANQPLGIVAFTILYLTATIRR